MSVAVGTLWVVLFSTVLSSNFVEVDKKYCEKAYKMSLSPQYKCMKQVANDAPV